MVLAVKVALWFETQSWEHAKPELFPGFAEINRTIERLKRRDFPELFQKVKFHFLNLDDLDLLLLVLVAVPS